MKKIYFFIALSLFFLCTNEKIKPELSEFKIDSVSNQITIIVNNPKKNSTNFGSGINGLTFSQVNINSEKTFDTIKIHLESYKKLYIKNANSFNSIIFKPKDSIVLNVNENSTSVHYVNKVLRKYDTIPLNNLYKSNMQNEIIAFNKLFKKFKSRDKKISETEYIKANFKKFKELNALFENKTNKKKQIVEQVYSNNLISEANYTHEISNLNYKLFSYLAKSYKLSNDDYYANKIDTLFFKNEIAFNDPFMSYGYLNIFIMDFILKNSSRINVNYKKAFDQLPDYFEGNQLKIFRTFCLHQLARQKKSSKVILEYFEKYKNYYTDTASINIFNRKYLLDSKKYNFTSENVELINNTLKKRTLQQIIDTNKGKIIYVDFWASWCSPCLAEMPDSKKLQREYKNKDIIILYISIDKNKNEWEKANKSLKLKESYSFLALNYPEADFYEKLKLGAIPRYLLFDKGGELIYENTPRPSSPEIRDLFDTQLK